MGEAPGGYGGTDDRPVYGRPSPGRRGIVLPGEEDRSWGAWESAAATVLFSVPAFALLVPEFRGDPQARGALDAAGWLIVAAGLAGAVALTLAARGVAFARTLLTVGASTGLAWLLVGLMFQSCRALGGVYKPLVIATLVAHCNLLPVALFEALGRVRRFLAEGTGSVDATRVEPDPAATRGTRRMIWGVAASAAGVDLTPVVLLIPPGHTRWIVTATWLAACITAGGVLTVLVTGEIAAYAKALEADDPPAGRAR